MIKESCLQEKLNNLENHRITINGISKERMVMLKVIF